MRIESADQVIRRIAEAHRSHGAGVLAFDGDGTLWSGDVGEDFFHAVLARGDFRPTATEEMREHARAHALPDHGTGRELAQRLYTEYMAGRFPEERICELMTWCCAEWTRDEVQQFSSEVARAVDVVRRIHPEVKRVLEWARTEAKAHGALDVFIVSASPRAIVEEAAKVVGIDADHIVAATPLYAGDRMQPKVDRPIPYGDGKVSRLRARTGETPLYAAFGDNAFDVALLSAALIPVAVRPKPRLRARAGEVADLVELSPEG